MAMMSQSLLSVAPIHLWMSHFIQVNINRYQIVLTFIMLAWSDLSLSRAVGWRGPWAKVDDQKPTCFRSDFLHMLLS